MVELSILHHGLVQLYRYETMNGASMDWLLFGICCGQWYNNIVQPWQYVHVLISDLHLQCICNIYNGYLVKPLFLGMSRFGEGQTPCAFIYHWHIYSIYVSGDWMARFHLVSFQPVHGPCDMVA